MHRLLWLDDDHSALLRWSTVLEVFGFLVIPALTSEEALGVMNTQPLDVLLVDLDLGESASGIDFIKTARSMNPSIPIFVLSGFLHDPRYAMHLDKLALNGVIEKPLPADKTALMKILMRVELATAKVPIGELREKYGSKLVNDYLSTVSADRTCFVVMPFKPRFDHVYEDIVRPLLEERRINCKRGDEIYSAGVVIDEIIEAIKTVDFVIAELTGRNPNVFYELGIAHQMGKPVILLTQRIEDVPFDLRHRRCLLYSPDHRGVKALEAALIKAVDFVVRSLPAKPPLAANGGL